MDKTRNKTWFNDSTLIACDIDEIHASLDDLGKHYQGLVSHYPGLTTVELTEHGDDFVTIKTNEGLMKRNHFSVVKAEDHILVEFDEEYITSKLVSQSHFVERFDARGGSTKLTVEISNMLAPGVLGFFLRNFGSKNIGNGFLSAYRKQFEQ